MTPRRCRAAVPVIHPRMTGRTSTEEVAAMPEPRDSGVKTLAIRLEDELHARLSFVAQVEGLGITDAIRQAIESYIENKHAESDFAERAAAMLDEIDRQAALRRAQIEELLGKNNKPKGRPRRGEEPPA
jgi:predicted DNA-binding protein